MVDANNKCCCYSRGVSWSAIFAGGLVGVGVGFLLNLFSIALGVSAFATGADGTSGLALGGVLAIFISTIVAMFFAGLTAGGVRKAQYCGNGGCYTCSSSCHMGSFYGFTTWTVTLIMSVILAMHMGHFVNYTTSKLANPNATVVVVDEPMPASATATAADQTATATPMTVDKMAHGIATAAFIAFFLFLVGAIACVLGAHWGLCCCKRKSGSCNTNPNLKP